MTMKAKQQISSNVLRGTWADNHGALKHLKVILLIGTVLAFSNRITKTAWIANVHELGPRKLRAWSAEKDGDTKAHTTTIPHILWFTYKTNILSTNEPREYYDNVLKTFGAYREAWNEPLAEVHFLDDVACAEKIAEAEPDLLRFFESEPNGAFRGDICRVALLYLYGGYYFDIDMEVVEPYLPDAGVTFTSVLACGGGCFFQSFVASVPGHPILKESMRLMHQEYVDDKRTAMLGPFAMYNAYRGLPEEQLSGIHLLDELQLDISPNPEWYKNFPRQKGHGNCNYVVDDRRKRVIYFYARFLGAGGCKPGFIPERIWISHKTNIIKSKEPKELYNNVMNTIGQYLDFWQRPDLSRKVKFIYDGIRCETKVRSIDPRFHSHYRANPENRLDICKMLILYQYGGYIFDAEMHVVEKFRAQASTGLVATVACGGACFFHGFIASVPGNPIVKLALENMLRTYETEGDSTMIGSVALANAYHSLSPDKRGGVELLEELQLDVGSDPMHYPQVKRLHEFKNCNTVLHDPEVEAVYFFSRFLGYKGCTIRSSN